MSPLFNMAKNERLPRKEWRWWTTVQVDSTTSANFDKCEARVSAQLDKTGHKFPKKSSKTRGKTKKMLLAESCIQSK